jgi:uncharacterized membrane protein YozB (DUF420 family)
VQVVPPGPDKRPLPPHENFPGYFSFLLVHMSGGTIAMLTMCLQLWPWLREHHPKWHRVSGRLYILGTLIGASAGLTIVWWAPQPGKVGAVCMLLFWLGTTITAYVAARQGNFARHRRFMLYSFAVAANNIWAIGTQMILTALHINIGYIYFAEFARWIPWVGNVFLVQWWLDRTANRPAPKPSGIESEPTAEQPLVPTSRAA